MYYDEMYITTRREIDICRKAIRKLERTIGANEVKYHLDSATFHDQYLAGQVARPEEFQAWHESYIALQRWQSRLKEHEMIMRL